MNLRNNLEYASGGGSVENCSKLVTKSLVVEMPTSRQNMVLKVPNNLNLDLNLVDEKGRTTKNRS